MYIAAIKSPNVGQPTFRRNGYKRFDPFITKDKPLLAMPERWRKLAEKLNLSAEAKLRLEWMIFYEVACDKDAYGRYPKN